jgi:hypothetical protein
MTSLDQFGAALDVALPPARAITPSSSLSVRKSISDGDIDVKIVASNLADREAVPFRLTDWLFRRRTYSPRDLDAISTRRSVYDDPALAEHYMPREGYENSHRFDISARWTFREERVGLLLIRISSAAQPVEPGFGSQNRLEGHVLGRTQLLGPEP